MEAFRLVFSPIEVNTYILADKSGKCAVIDCGCCSDREFDRFTEFLEKKRLEPLLLLNTHCHFDHIFGNARFMKKYGIGAWCHLLEEENRKESVMHAGFFGISMEMPPDPVRFLNDGEILEFGSTSLEVIHVPGHTAGSIAFYCRENGSVYSGDTLFNGSVGRTDLPGGDFGTLIHSIKSRLFALPPSTVVFPGHGGRTTIEKELKTNPYFSDANG